MKTVTISPALLFESCLVKEATVKNEEGAWFCAISCQSERRFQDRTSHIVPSLTRVNEGLAG